MELRDYLRVARRRWKLIVGCVAETLALARLVTMRAAPEYMSTARLFVSTSQRVIDRLNLDLTPSDLAFRTSATVVPETVILPRYQRIAHIRQLLDQGLLDERLRVAAE